MIDANPICFNSGTACAFVAPAHAIVVSRFLKLVTPATVFSVTCCANAAAPMDNAARLVTTDSETLMNASARIMLRNAAVSPPAEKFHRSAMLEHAHGQSKKQRDQSH